MSTARRAHCAGSLRSPRAAKLAAQAASCEASRKVPQLGGALIVLGQALRPKLMAKLWVIVMLVYAVDTYSALRSPDRIIAVIEKFERTDDFPSSTFLNFGMATAAFYSQPLSLRTR